MRQRQLFYPTVVPALGASMGPQPQFLRHHHGHAFRSADGPPPLRPPFFSPFRKRRVAAGTQALRPEVDPKAGPRGHLFSRLQAWAGLHTGLLFQLRLLAYPLLWPISLTSPHPSWLLTPPSPTLVISRLPFHFLPLEFLLVPRCLPPRYSVADPSHSQLPVTRASLKLTCMPSSHKRN